MARFRREAQPLAAVNHPNIASVHGFELSGETPALVTSSWIACDSSEPAGAQFA
jgi:hypothetical protein